MSCENSHTNFGVNSVSLAPFCFSILDNQIVTSHRVLLEKFTYPQTFETVGGIRVAG